MREVVLNDDREIGNIYVAGKVGVQAILREFSKQKINQR